MLSVGMAEQPLWLQLVLRLERAIGEPVESALRSSTYFDLLTQANRGRARAAKLTEAWTREWLHLMNLPSGSDVRRLQAQLSRVERTLGALAREVGGHEAESDGSPASRDTTD
jgi:hypothetical protein